MQGRRAKALAEKKLKPKPKAVFDRPTTWEPGDRILINSGDGDRFKAELIKVGDAKAKVRFDVNGKVDIVSRKFIYKIPRCPNGHCVNEASANHRLCEDCLKAERSGELRKSNIRDARSTSEIDRNAINWTSDKCHFNFKLVTEDESKLNVYGWYRRTKIARTDEIVHAIDIFVLRDDQDYTVGQITYSYDPRENLKALNADISARVQQWLSTQLRNKASTIDDLRKLAEHPKIHINKIETIDYILIKLREMRDTAIRAGGHRLFDLKGDTGPSVHITIDVSSQALLLKGKVPTLEAGGMYDVAKDGVARRAPQKVQADPANIAALVKQLKHTKDKREARKLRGLLREMGHKGGARSQS